MAGIDTSIFGNLLAPPKTVEQYDAEAQQAQSNKISNLLGNAKLQEYQNGIERSVQLRNLLSGGSDSAKLRSAGYLDEANKWDESSAKVQNEKSQAGKYDADAFKARAEGVAKKADYYNDQVGRLASPEAAVAFLTHAYNDPDMGAIMKMSGKTLEQGIAEIPRTAAEFQDWQAQVAGGIGKIRDHALAVRREAEVERNNKAQNGVAHGNLAVAQGNLGVSRDRLAFDRAQPKGQIVQTDQGTMVIDPRSGSAIPATGPGGLPLTRPLKDIPPTVNKAIVENSQNLSKIQQALDLLDGKQVGKLTGDQNATGWKGYVPQGVLNRVDASGVDTRAMIADIGSLVLHDRSGAAVTASESPRLYPFIPLATDDPETAKKKLTRFKQLYEQENQALGETYSKDQGYRDNPMLKRSPSGNLPTKPSGRTVVRTGTHQGRKVTQFSDGSIVYAD